MVVFVDEDNGDVDNIPSDGEGLDGDDETSDESEADSDVSVFLVYVTAQRHPAVRVSGSELRSRVGINILAAAGTGREETNVSSCPRSRWTKWIHDGMPLIN